MKAPRFRTVIALVSILLCGLFYCARAARLQETLSTPILSIASAEQDMGNISGQEELHVTFDIHNVGGRRLVLNKIDHCASCGDGVPAAIVIPPRRSTKLAIPFDTRFASGHIKRVAAFATNDPAFPLLRLTASAFVDDK